jgi:protein TonB
VIPTQAPVVDTAGTTPAAGTAPAAAPATSQIDQLTVDQLFKEARTALNEQRLVAPPRNNALEFYLKILEKEPSNSGAQDALRELFQFAASAAEQAVNARNMDEAQRVIDLLNKADPNNYTLTMLRSKLDAQRKIVEREAQQQQAQQEAQARRQAELAAGGGTTASPSGTTPTTAATPTSTATTAGGGTTATPTTTAAATPTPVAATPTPAARPAGGESREAQIVKSYPPQYPQAALRKREEGWVEVEFTVTAEGSVANAHVVDSQPARIFDRAALEAVARWSFSPALREGQATEASIRRRIEFKMGGGG